MAYLLVGAALFSAVHLLLFGTVCSVRRRTGHEDSRAGQWLTFALLGLALAGGLGAYLDWWRANPPLGPDGSFSRGEPLAPTAALGLGLFSLPLSGTLCLLWVSIRVFAGKPL